MTAKARSQYIEVGYDSFALSSWGRGPGGFVGSKLVCAAEFFHQTWIVGWNELIVEIFIMSWTGLLGLMFSSLLCVDWSNNCRNQHYLHSFSVKTWNLPESQSPQNNGYQTSFHVPVVTFYIQRLRLDTWCNYTLYSIWRVWMWLTPC